MSSRRAAGAVEEFPAKTLSDAHSSAREGSSALTAWVRYHAAVSRRVLRSESRVGDSSGVGEELAFAGVLEAGRGLGIEWVVGAQHG